MMERKVLANEAPGETDVACIALVCLITRVIIMRAAVNCAELVLKYAPFIGVKISMCSSSTPSRSQSLDASLPSRALLGSVPLAPLARARILPRLHTFLPKACRVCK